MFYYYVMMMIIRGLGSLLLFCLAILATPFLWVMMAVFVLAAALTELFGGSND